MKKIFTLFMLYYFSFNVCAQHEQSRRNVIWLLGNGRHTATNRFAPDTVTRFDFIFGDSLITTFEKRAGFDSSSSNSFLCTKEGQLVAYSNACNIWNGKGQVIKDATLMTPNPSNILNRICPRGNNLWTAHILLPSENDSLLHFFTGTEMINERTYCYCSRWFLLQ